MHFFPACGCLNNGCNSAGASFASPNKDHALPFPHPRCRSSLLYLRRRKRQVQESDFQTSALFATEQNPLCSYLKALYLYMEYPGQLWGALVDSLWYFPFPNVPFSWEARKRQTTAGGALVGQPLIRLGSPKAINSHSLHPFP